MKTNRSWIRLNKPSIALCGRTWTRSASAIISLLNRGLRFEQLTNSFKSLIEQKEANNVNDYRDHITIDPGKRGGKPCIRSMRITVYDVLEWLAFAANRERQLSTLASV